MDCSFFTTLVVICLLHFLQFHAVVFCAKNTEKFYLRPELSGKICHADDTAFTETTPSRITCMDACSQNSTCKSVSYNTADFTCTGCTGIYTVSSNLLDRADNIFYESEYHKDECAVFGSLCQNGATCIDAVYAYTCACSGGWTGTFCETDINECDSNPCQNGATCVNGQNSYTCTCASGWAGTNCEQDVNECGSSPCQNGATCVNGQNSYTCTCASGWSGANCDQDINECDSNPCQNGATCVNGQNSYTCTCASGWMGSNCAHDLNECDSNPCQNGATCMNGQNSYTCTCVSGWAGSNCEQDINECGSNPCQNGATCVNGQNSYTCTCAGGWSGTNCEQDVNECDNNPCQNGATCVNGQNSYTCTCASGWTGSNCEQDVNECDNNPCQNGATCVNGQNSYTCTCASGWTGSNCEQDVNECDSNPCENGATCVNGQNSYTCTCASGWTGTNCEQDINECDSNPCQNGATCVNGQNSYTCTCASGWAGNNCEHDVNECDSNPCQNGATCVNGQSSYTCTCASGWMGTNCEQDVNECDSNPCQNGATCVNGQNSYTCNCASGWMGTNCGQALSIDGNQIGTRFVTGFLYAAISNKGIPQLMIVPTVASQTNVYVTIPFLGIYQEHHTLQDHLLLEYPNSLVITTVDAVSSNGVEVTSDQPVSLYSLCRYSGVGEGTLELPTSVLGQLYIIDTHSAVTYGKAQILVVAVYDLTDVTFVLPSGTTFTVTLNHLETYRRIATATEPSLAGTMISASSPVAVHAGHPCTNIPNDSVKYCENIVESVPAVEALGSVFVVPYQEPRTMYSIGVAAPYDSTEITLRDITGVVLEVIQLNERQSIFRTFYSSQIISVTATQNILLSQYSHGKTDGNFGDPSLLYIPAQRQFENEFYFAFPTYYSTGVISIVIDSIYDSSELQLNGSPVVVTDPVSATVPDIGIFLVFYVNVNGGVTYTLSHTNPNARFGAMLYAFTSVEQYSTALGYLLKTM